MLWTPTHGRAKAGRPARTYIQQLCEDMGCCPEDPPEAMNDREKWRERVRDIRATSTTWWWSWWLLSNKRSSYVIFIDKKRLKGKSFEQLSSAAFLFDRKCLYHFITLLWHTVLILFLKTTAVIWLSGFNKWRQPLKVCV